MFKIIRLKIHLPACHSLKDKRQVLKGIIERAKRLNISIAETASNDIWNLAEITFATVSNSHYHNDQIIEKVIALFDNDFRLTILEIEEIY